MSDDITSVSETRQIYGGNIIEVAEVGLEKAIRILAGIPAGAKKAVGSALARAGKSGQTFAKRAVTQEYTLSQSTFLKYTRNINHFTGKSNSDLSVVFGFAGHTIPLISFSTVIADSGILVNVRKDTGQKLLEHAFVANAGHLGIFERVGKSRLPIQEFYGPATPQMMYSNEEVMDAIEDKVVETFEKRIDHEIDRVLNGW